MERGKCIGVGEIFKNYEHFFETFQKFCRDSYQPFVVTSNNQRRVQMACRHGYLRPSSSTGKRTLKEFEKSVRAGRPLPGSEQFTGNDSETIKTLVIQTISEPPAVEAVHTKEKLPTTSEERFHFTFREKVKARGRPKRPAKLQLCSFNKSLTDRKSKSEKRISCSSTDSTQEPPTKKIKKRLLNTGSDEDDDVDIGPTCLICFSSITNITRATRTFTPCCRWQVRKKCWKNDGCPKRDDFSND